MLAVATTFLTSLEFLYTDFYFELFSFSLISCAWLQESVEELRVDLETLTTAVKEPEKELRVTRKKIGLRFLILAVDIRRILN